MPAYSSIETYIRCDEKNYSSEIKKFRGVLAQIGFDEEYLESNFTDLRWDICDNGFIYSGCNSKLVMVNLFGTMLNIRPIAIGLTPQIKDIKEPWLEFEVMFLMDDIISFFPTIRIKDEVKIPLWSAMLLLSKYCRETGVYLVNEGTDKIWEAMSGDFWNFDAAIIPNTIAADKNDLHKNYIIKETNDDLFLVNRQMWNKAPWEA